MDKKPYINTTCEALDFVFGVILIGILLMLTPLLTHINVVDKFSEDALGPCFGAITGHSDMKDIKNPEKYSGYSVIIDTVKYEYTQSGQKVREDELPKKQTMKINGKEYVLE
jgi:hypothetical protein